MEDILCIFNFEEAKWSVLVITMEKELAMKMRNKVIDFKSKILGKK